MKIRKYVLDLIATDGDQPQQIPSSRKLGEMFGVTHPTALRAIQTLIEDGYLIPTRGGGSMTCPANCNLKNVKLFGFLEGDGKIAFDIYYTVRLYSIAAQELTRRNLTYCCQHLYLNTPADLETAVKENHLAGLIALSVGKPKLKEEIRKMKEKGLPVVSLIVPHPGVSSYSRSHKNYYAMILDRIFSEGRAHAAILVSPAFTEDGEINLAVQEMCMKYSVPEKQILILKNTPEETAKRLEEMLGFGMRFDAVIGNHNIFPAYEVLKKYVDLEEECRVVNSEFSIYDEMKYTGYVIKYELEKIAPAMIDDLLYQLNHKNAPVKNETIGTYFAFYKNGIQISSQKTMEEKER